MEAFISSIIQNYLYAGVFMLLLACGLGVPMPEDVILVTGGYVSHLYPQSISLTVLILVSMTGVLIGDTIIFTVGRRFGPRAMTLPLFRNILTRQRLGKMEGYFSSYGNKIIFVSRFMAGIRAPLFMSAGISGVPFRRFILFDGLAALISVPMFILLANYFGEEIDQLKHMLVRAQKAVFVIVPLIILVWLLFKKFAWKREEEMEELKDEPEGDDTEGGEQEAGSGKPPEAPSPESHHPMRRKTDIPAPAAPPGEKPPEKMEEDL
jgi:membrane protein DedA with SNARE-associated domain